MSSIFGCIAKKKNFDFDQCTAAMTKWNRSYGTGTVMIWQGAGMMMGFCPSFYERGLEASQTYFLEEPCSCTVCDALIFNREIFTLDKENTDSDNQWLRAYLNHREITALREVNGDFSGAIYQKDRLILFRDHLGIRPLFYYQDSECVLFSTDIRGILAVQGRDHTFDDISLYSWMNGLSTDISEMTDFKCIKAVKPGHILTIAQNQTDQRPYWIPGEKIIRFENREDYFKTMRSLTFDAVKRRAEKADGPIGSEMSGGLDSTVLAVILKQLGHDLACFSWSPSPTIFPFQEKCGNSGECIST